MLVASAAAVRRGSLMLSVGRRDGRRLSELGFVAAGGVEMEDTELEEGEALSDYQDEEAGVNPDTDFSYLVSFVHLLPFLSE